MRFPSAALFFVAIFAATLFAQDQSKPLPFRVAIELALRNSAATAAAQADVQRARASVAQAKDFYIPQVVAGSGLGFSYGFPLSLEGAAPSIFNVNFQGGLFNLAQRENIRAARSEVDIAQAQAADRRNDVIMEAALDYIQLDLLESSLAVQREQQEAASKLQDIVRQRVESGLDSQVELTRARLVVARTRLDINRTVGAADQLRLRLAQLTGLPSTAIQTVTESIPGLPQVRQEQDLTSQTLDKNLTVRIADFVSQAKEHRALAEHRQLYPTVDLAGQYAVLALFNNYLDFFKTFQRNNLTAGAAIRIPLFNFGQRAAAQAARFDAAKARAEAKAVKEQASTDTLRLQRSVEELTAAREVAQLEHQLALSDIDTTHAKIESGGATLKDEENARVAEHERYTAYLSSAFDLDKAQVQLLRQIGEMETWALGPKR
ncbi:MAG TPA: TolC family protein [Candidatus Angelobacter sp.]|nr:TolC family protein [Candidatus Angelobacter sp.]